MTPCLLLLPLLLAPGPAPPAGPLRLEIAWSLEVEGSAAPLLAASETLLVVADPGGALRALDPLGGAPRWEKSLPGPIAAPPILAADRVALIAGESLHLLSAADGAEAFPPKPVAAPCALSADHDRLAMACADGAVTLLDLSTGNPLWTLSLPASPPLAPAFCGSILLAGTAGGAIEAIAMADGRQLWSRALPGGLSTPALCSGRNAWAGTLGNRLHALRIGPRRGNPRWSYRTGGDIAGSLQRFGEEVLFFSMDAWAYALRADSGHLAWRARLGHRPGGSARVGDLLHVAPLNAERLEIFRLPGGSRAGWWDTQAGVERLVAGPVAAGNGVVAAIARYGRQSATILRLVPAGAAEASAPSGSPR